MNFGWQVVQLGRVCRTDEAASPIQEDRSTRLLLLLRQPGPLAKKSNGMQYASSPSRSSLELEKLRRRLRTLRRRWSIRSWASRPHGSPDIVGTPSACLTSHSQSRLWSVLNTDTSSCWSSGPAVLCLMLAMGQTTVLVLSRVCAMQYDTCMYRLHRDVGCC